MLIKKVIDLATDSIQNCFHPNTCVKNTSIDKTTESSVSRGTILHILPRNTLPLVFLGHIINSARLLTSGSFFSMTALLPARVPLHFRSLYPTFSISCGAHYFTMALTCSLLAGAAVQLNHKARPTPGKMQMKSRTQWNGRSEWLQRELKFQMPISGKAQSWKGAHLGSMRSANMKQARTDKEQHMSLGSDSTNMSKHYALM